MCDLMFSWFGKTVAAASYGSAMMHLLKHRYNKSRILFERAGRFDKKMKYDQGFNIMLGYVRVKCGDAKAAREPFEAGLEMYVNKPTTDIKLRKWWGDCLVEYVHIIESDGESEKAQMTLKQIDEIRNVI